MLLKEEKEEKEEEEYNPGFKQRIWVQSEKI